MQLTKQNPSVYGGSIKKLLGLILLLASAAVAGAQTNVLFGYAADYGLNPVKKASVTLSLVSPNPYTVGQTFIRQNTLATTTDTNFGYFAFTNIQSAVYSLVVAGTEFPTIYVYTNTLGAVPLAALWTNTAAGPPMSSLSNYLTQAQSQALFIQSILAGQNIFVTNYGNGSWLVAGLGNTNALSPYQTFLLTNAVQGIAAGTTNVTLATTNNVVTISVAASGGGGGYPLTNTDGTIAITPQGNGFTNLSAAPALATASNLTVAALITATNSFTPIGAGITNHQSGSVYIATNGTLTIGTPTTLFQSQYQGITNNGLYTAQYKDGNSVSRTVIDAFGNLYWINGQEISPAVGIIVDPAGWVLDDGNTNIGAGTWTGLGVNYTGMNGQYLYDLNAANLGFGTIPYPVLPLYAATNGSSVTLTNFGGFNAGGSGVVSGFGGNFFSYLDVSIGGTASQINGSGAYFLSTRGITFMPTTQPGSPFYGNSQLGADGSASFANGLTTVAASGAFTAPMIYSTSLSNSAFAGNITNNATINGNGHIVGQTFDSGNGYGLTGVQAAVATNLVSGANVTNLNIYNTAGTVLTMLGNSDVKTNLGTGNSLVLNTTTISFNSTNLLTNSTVTFAPDSGTVTVSNAAPGLGTNTLTLPATGAATFTGGFAGNGYGLTNVPAHTLDATAAGTVTNIANASAQATLPWSIQDFNNINWCATPVIPYNALPGQLTSFSPCVFTVSNQVVVLYTAAYASALTVLQAASGPDITQLGKSSIVLTNATNTWCQGWVSGPNVLQIRGNPTNYVYYFGGTNQASESTPMAVGLAFTMDGSSYTQYANNPIITQDTGLTTNYLFRPYCVQDNAGLFHLFLNGSRSNSVQLERMVEYTAPTPYGPFTQLPNYVYGPNNTNTSWRSGGVGDPCILPVPINGQPGYVMFYSALIMNYGGWSGEGWAWSMDLTNWYDGSTNVFTSTAWGNPVRRLSVFRGDNGRYMAIADNSGANLVYGTFVPTWEANAVARTNSFGDLNWNYNGGGIGGNGVAFPVSADVYMYNGAGIHFNAGSPTSIYGNGSYSLVINPQGRGSGYLNFGWDGTLGTTFGTAHVPILDSTGTNLSGVAITASSYAGNASGLTNLSAANIAGTLANNTTGTAAGATNNQFGVPFGTVATLSSNAVVSMATNGLGSAAYSATSAFDASGAALQATNHLSTGAFTTVGTLASLSSATSNNITSVNPAQIFPAITASSGLTNAFEIPLSYTAISGAPGTNVFVDCSSLTNAGKVSFLLILTNKAWLLITNCPSGYTFNIDFYENSVGGYRRDYPTNVAEGICTSTNMSPGGPFPYNYITTNANAWSFDMIHFGQSSNFFVGTMTWTNTGAAYFLR